MFSNRQSVDCPRLVLNANQFTGSLVYAVLIRIPCAAISINLNTQRTVKIASVITR